MGGDTTDTTAKGVGSMPNGHIASMFDHNRVERVEDLWALYPRLHATCPVLHTEASGGYYMLSRHADVRGAAADWQTFSSAHGVARPPLPMRAAAIDYDPPEHGFWRDLFREVLNLATYREFADRVAVMADDLIDGFAGRGEAELVAELTDVLPVSVICEVIGIHDAERAAQVQRVAVDVFRAVGDPATQGRFMGEFVTLCLEEVQARREQPREDYLTRLATGEVEDGRVLDDAEIISLLTGFLFAGHHTTSSVMASLLHRVTADPELRDALAADPERIPKAVEESIRLDTPLHGFFRTTTKDAEIAGTRIPEGASVMLNFAAANRDAAAFEQADAFRLDRSPSPHLGFGHGIHTCVGAQLARLELRITLQRIIARLPDIASTGEPPVWRWLAGTLQTIERVAVTFTPEDTSASLRA
jgi:cytochrome P450